MWKLICLIAMLAASFQSQAASTLFDYGSTWKYKIGTEEASNPTSGWRAVSFDDSSWESGVAPIGYSTSPNNGYEETLVTPLPTSTEAGYLSVFLRRNFTVTNPSSVRELTLNVVADDGFVVWVNGNYIGSYNVGTQEPTFDTVASTPVEPEVQTITVNGDMSTILRSGNNVIAVMLLNANAPSSDLFFDAVLTTDLDQEAPVIKQVLPEPGSRVRELTVIDVIFNEPVTGIQAADLLVNNQPATSIEAVSPVQYIFRINQPANGAVNVAWVANHGITDTAGTPNAFQAVPWSYTVDSSLPIAQVVISEFMASNENGIRDEDGTRSDWIEIFNMSNLAVNLNGWFLTDDTNALTKWALPAENLGPGNYLLIWASGKNKTVAGSPLHTNFKLGKSGGFLALVSPSTNVVSTFGASYPTQRDDISYGRDTVNAEVTGYFTSPSPGFRNLSIGSGFAPEPQFSHASGIYTNTTLTVSITAPSGQIRYTLDGSVPTSISTLYSGPINVNGSTTIKARVFQAGLLPSEVVGRVYKMVDNTVGNFTSTLPVLIFNTGGRSIASEVQPGNPRTFASVAMLDTFRGRSAVKGQPHYLGYCELEVRGQTSSGFPKRPYNMEIQNVYRFDEDAEILGFPSGSDFALINPYSDKPFLQNFLAYELHEKMGHYAVRRRFVEVFLNTGTGKVTYSQYAGIYLLVEKIRADGDRVDIEELAPGMNSEPEISGGYIFKKDKPSNGDQVFYTSGGAGFSGQELRIHEPKPREVSFEQIDWLQNYLNRMEDAMYASNWKTATGTNHYSHYLDVDSFVDYHWIVEFPKQIDGYRISNYMSKDRNGKVKMEPIWDWNLSFGNADYLTGDSTSGWYYTQISDNDHIWLRRLISGTPDAFGTSGDPDFNQKIADRWSVLRTNIMNETVLLRRIDEMAAILSEPAARDFAKYPRLGQYVWPNPSFYVTPTTYAGIISAMKNWVSGRYRWIDSQFIKPPILNVNGGFVAPGTSVTITGTPGTIYYTTDGSDPRLPGGALSSKAKPYTAPITIGDNTKIFARLRNGTKWSGPTVAPFTLYRPTVAITEVMYHPAMPPAGSVYADEDFEYIEIRNSGSAAIELGGYQFAEGVQFTFPSSRLEPGARVLVVKNRTAFQSRYGSTLPIAGEFTGSLDNAGERIALSGALGEPIADFEYKDTWQPLTDGPGFSLVLDNESSSSLFWNDSSAWRVSSAVGGSPGQEDAPQTLNPIVVVNEVVANPAEPNPEQIELLNLSSVPADISGWWLTDNTDTPKKYRLPAGSVIPAHGYLVLSGTNFSTAFNLSSLGEEVYLYSADAAGNLTGYSHGFEFGATPVGSGTGRFVSENGTEIYMAQTAATLGSANSASLSAVRISEIMYRPRDVVITNVFWNNTEDEYIEIWNPGSTAIPLFDTDRPTDTWKVGGSVDFTFPANTTIAAYSGVVVVNFDPAQNSAALSAFRTKYNIAAEIPIFGPYSESLPNGDGTVTLRQPLAPITTGAEAGTVPYMVVERVSYGDGSSWPAGADGLGYSLTRISLNDWAFNPSNWTAASPSPGVLTVPGNGPSIQQQPFGTFAKPGTQVTLTSLGTGTGTVTYQWRLNGVNLPWGTNATLVITNATLAQSGEYRVIISDNAGATTSQAAFVQVGNDSDDDKVQDDWEIAFGSNPYAADAIMDLDSDGVSNLGEFYAGTDARDANSVLRINQVNYQAGVLRLSFTAQPGRNYLVQYTTALGSGNWQTVGAYSSGNGERGEIFVNHNTAGAAMGFYRVVPSVTP